MTTTQTSRPARRSAQRVVEALTAHGVEYVFGVPGAKIDSVFDVLADMGPQLVVCRHEQNAAFMAGAIGRLTGTPGVVLVTSGPGTANLATGLLTANTEQDPVVALCGAVDREDRLKRTHQSMDAAALMKAVTKFTGEINDPDNAPEAVANAFRAATTAPQGAAAVILPQDVLAAPTCAGLQRVLPTPALGSAPADAIGKAANLIRQAQRPALLVGSRGADPQSCTALRALVAATGLPVVETFQAAGVVSRALEDHYLGRGFARYMLLRPILMDARSGSLHPNWREHLTLDALGYPPEARLADSNKLALLEIATMGVQAWETQPYTGPFTGLGWRVALDSWYAAVLELEDCHDRTRRPLGGGADAPPEMKRLIASLTRSPVVAEQNARLAEGRRRWRDWTGCWYHAGLAAGGLNVDWRGWYRSRIATWTSGDSALEGPSAAGELAKLDSGRLDHFETLPAYWLS